MKDICQAIARLIDRIDNETLILLALVALFGLIVFAAVITSMS